MDLPRLGRLGASSSFPTTLCLHAAAHLHRRVTADLIAHLAETDSRRLHVDKGFPSLFAYCIEELRFSEDEACRRIEAARLSRRFPAILELVETGAISLTVLGLLKPHLNDDNYEELLRVVAFSTVRVAKERIAARFPLPDVPSSIRKLPDRRIPTVVASSAANNALAPARVENGTLFDPATSDTVPAPTRVVAAEADFVPAPAPVASDTAPVNRHDSVEPLSAERFLVKFTAGRALRGKIETARDLMRHANPDPGLAAVIERAVDLLIRELEKRRKGRIDADKAKARREKATAELRIQEAPASGYIARSARRDVVTRDGWRCSFVSDDGRRCEARTLLEFDHRVPRALGGDSGSDNLRILCRAHNQRAAEREFGRAHVARMIATRRKSA